MHSVSFSIPVLVPVSCEVGVRVVTSLPMYTEVHGSVQGVLFIYFLSKHLRIGLLVLSETGPRTENCHFVFSERKCNCTFHLFSQVD